MGISKEQAAHVARLAKIELDPGRLQLFTGQLNAVLRYMEVLEQLDTAGVVPTTRVIPLENVFRADRVHPPASPQRRYLESAPSCSGNFFSVPKVI
jgi:aspartyl-tRNA(Asn)/glutamyl-tRNA(Gln) amidotransferase subunit C